MVRDGCSALNGYLRIDEAIAAAAERLASVSDSARLEAELLLARALDVPRSYLYAHPDDTMDAEAQKRFGDTVGRRAAGLPLAYITGTREFWSMELMVSRDTLVPRPETELVVEQALARMPRRAKLRVLDLGTGSGAIALALARERPNWDFVATDVSLAALAVARENARQHDLPNVEFRSGSWFEPVRGERFDIVVSNPPYVCETDPALAELSFEPREALASGADGLDALRVIAKHAGAVLHAGGALVVEHGEQQGDVLSGLLDEYGWTEIRTCTDFAGKPRVTVATR